MREGSFTDIVFRGGSVELRFEYCIWLVRGLTQKPILLGESTYLRDRFVNWKFDLLINSGSIVFELLCVLWYAFAICSRPGLSCLKAISY